MRSDREPGDGTIIDGAAISVIDRGYPGGEPYVDIQGGKFVSGKIRSDSGVHLEH